MRRVVVRLTASRTSGVTGACRYRLQAAISALSLNYLWIFIRSLVSLRPVVRRASRSHWGSMWPLVIYDFLQQPRRTAVVGRKTLAGLSSRKRFLSSVGCGKSHRFPRTEPLIFLRVVLPVCRTGIALSTSA
jgi:hypothetical protein